MSSSNGWPADAPGLHTAFYSVPNRHAIELKVGTVSTSLVQQALRGAGRELWPVPAAEPKDGDSATDHTPGGWRRRGAELARQVLAAQGGACGRPLRSWVTVGLCSNAPDWVGPLVSRELGIPYLVVEPVTGPWAADRASDEERTAALSALQQARLVVTTRTETARSLGALLTDPSRLIQLLPFLDVAPFLAASQSRDAHRGAVAAQLGLPLGSTWLITAGPQQAGPALESYRWLARALSRLPLLDWHLLIVGHGSAARDVREAYLPLPQSRVHWWPHATRAEQVAALAASDLYLWPGLGTVGGDTLLEAQAAGTAVVACHGPGNADRVVDGRTGRLVDNVESFANAVSFLLRHPQFRIDFGRHARQAMVTRHDVRVTAAALKEVL